MISLTYGTLPEHNAFDRAFERECPDGTYHIVNDKAVGSVDWTCSETWRFITKTVARFEAGETDIDSHGMDLASGLLLTLGFEWV